MDDDASFSILLLLVQARSIKPKENTRILYQIYVCDLLYAIYDVLVMFLHVRSCFEKNTASNDDLRICTTDLVILTYALYVVQYIRKVFS